MNAFAPAIAALALLQAEPAPGPSREPAASPAPSAEPSPAASRAGAPSPASTTARPPTSAATPTSTSTPAATPAPAASPAAPRARIDPEAERAEAERAARAFLAALAASDADGLAAAAADRFSFDGEDVSGRGAVRGRWRALLAARAGPAPRVVAVEVLPSAEAVARLGKPPARVAPLARPGAWVALGDVGGRPVTLFLAREGGRMAVLGVHD